LRRIGREHFSPDLLRRRALDRNELGALLVAAGLGSPAEHATYIVAAYVAGAAR
jgi:hypothetical protein